MSLLTAIGRTKGPGETEHEFTFVTPDPDGAVKTGEFVFFDADIDGAPRSILGRVGSRRPLRLVPDAFMADPTLAPEVLTAALGYDGVAPELYEATATVLGYYDEGLGDFVNPRIPPRAGLPLYLAPDEMLSRVLSKKKPGETGSAHIGSLLSRPADRVPITLDVAAVCSTHLAIIANTGAGKSYLAGVLIEELMKPQNRAAVLIIDPHGEWGTLEEMANHADHFTVARYQPVVNVRHPGDVKIRVSALTLGDLQYLLPNLSDRMAYLLRRAHRDVQKASRATHGGNADKWTLMELRERVHAIGQQGGDDEEQENDRYAETADAVSWRLDSTLANSVLFDDYRNVELSELCRPGQCTVLQLNEVDEREQQVMVAALLRRLFQARRDTEKGLVDEKDGSFLDYPVFVLMEEAHTFAPAGADAVSARILKQILGEGRKFGLGVGLISQRPGKLDADVLSQCNTQFIMRIVNPVDQARVAESVETVGRDLLDELPALSKGQVIVAGTAVNTPVLCRVRSRHTPHGAESKDAPVEWQRWFSDARQAQRVRETAPIAPPRRDGAARLFKPER